MSSSETVAGQSDGSASGSPSSHEQRPAIDAVRSLLELADRAVTAYGRPDLEQAVEGVRDVIENPGVHVVVCGEFKQGKSSLVNALVGAEVCPVDDDIATAVPTFVGWAGAPRALALPIRTDSDEPLEPRPLDLETVRTEVVEGSAERTLRVRVGLPAPALRRGLVLVDTPGVGGLASGHGAATLSALADADAVLFVSDASREFTAGEIEFLKHASRLCTQVLCVMTKIDLYPSADRVVGANEEHLRAAGLDIPILPVSSKLHQAADARASRDLRLEARFEPLQQHLQSVVAGQVDGRVAGRALRTIAEICAKLTGPFEAEQQVLSSPETAEAVMRSLQTEKEAAEHLRSTASKWSTTLGDGVADLNSDVSHDLRARIRAIQHEADLALEESDPVAIWDEFETWLYSRTAAEIMENFTLMRASASELSGAVASHFQAEIGDDDAAVEGLDFDPSPTMEGIDASATVKFEVKGAAERGLGAVRGAQGGLFMVRSGLGLVFASLSPMAVPALAASLGAGLLLGRKSMSDERKRDLDKARSQAKASVRKYLDSVSFTMTKHSQDSMRQLQRSLRDHYGDLAQQTLRSASEAYERAAADANRSESERAERLKVVEAELARLREFRSRIEAVGSRVGAVA